MNIRSIRLRRSKAALSCSWPSWRPPPAIRSRTALDLQHPADHREPDRPGPGRHGQQLLQVRRPATPTPTRGDLDRGRHRQGHPLVPAARSRPGPGQLAYQDIQLDKIVIAYTRADGRNTPGRRRALLLRSGRLRHRPGRDAGHADLHPGPRSGQAGAAAGDPARYGRRSSKRRPRSSSTARTCPAGRSRPSATCRSRSPTSPTIEENAHETPTPAFPSPGTRRPPGPGRGLHPVRADIESPDRALHPVPDLRPGSPSQRHPGHRGAAAPRSSRASSAETASRWPTCRSTSPSCPARANSPTTSPGRWP